MTEQVAQRPARSPVRHVLRWLGVMILCITFVVMTAWATLAVYYASQRDQTYDLNDLWSIDFALCYWGSEAIAHGIVSFGFADGQYLAVSIETRREKSESYSANGVLDDSIPFEQLKKQSRINNVAMRLGNASNFSSQIRVGLPDPNTHTNQSHF